MHNNSIEALLLRNYGESSPVPEALEQHLVASVHREAAEMNRTEALVTNLYEKRISRRRMVQWVALGSAGLGALSASVAGLHDVVSPQDSSSRPAYA